ncbi:Putative signal peptide peptidase SppA [Poriferisphaera corsica]|uniref:Signal peptide peptidase SppA n=1 Tax=Poriferisphaera corsica TaxID=2528020 RepID=A0A517YVF4_9BACT|nr:signal peptide peptidase SppA [Poriferisphaera corsica]QDU34215.1 Putative signal peptide peptidase SppA [Poriferisphaera corsica]
MTNNPTPPPAGDQPSSRPPISGLGTNTPPTPPSNIPQVIIQPPKEGGKFINRIVKSLLIFSIFLNFYMGWIIYASIQSGPYEKLYLEGSQSNRIVILPISGTVDYDMYDFVRKSLEQLAKDKPKAIVLRVNSGGGYVNASDQIWHQIAKFKEEHKIPIIASFAGVAASGAYYVSAPADAIVIERTGLTGSIGVIAQAFTVDGLMTKIGVTPKIVTSTDSVDKDELSMFREWTPKDYEFITHILDNAYEQFVSVVYEGRKSITFDGKTRTLTEEQVRELATGKVYTATEALENGLVDEIGYLDRAIEVAATQAQIPSTIKPHVTQMTAPKAGLLSVLGASSQNLPTMDSDRVRSWVTEMSQVRLAYQMQLD